MQAVHAVCGETIRWTLTLIKSPLLSHDPKPKGGGWGGGSIINHLMDNQSAVGDFFHQLFDFTAHVAAIFFQEVILSVLDHFQVTFDLTDQVS